MKNLANDAEVFNAIKALLGNSQTVGNQSVGNTSLPDLLNTTSTNVFAAILDEQPASLRSELCRTGSVKGVKPIKMPGRTGRLRWPWKDIEALFLRLKEGK